MTPRHFLVDTPTKKTRPSGGWVALDSGDTLRGVHNVAELVRTAAAQSPQHGLAFRDQSVTWTDLDASIDARARGLLTLGLSASDRVVIALPNTLDFVVNHFAALRAGLISVPTNPGYTARELDHVLTDSAASMLIGTEAVLAAAGSRPIHSFLPTQVPDSADGSLGESGDEDIAVLLYTSGTSGAAKGAMLSHRALLANLTQIAQISPPVYSPGDRVLLALPLFHAYGLGPGLHAVAFQGCSGVLVERFDPVDTLEVVRREQVTMIAGVPPMFVAWSLLPDAGPALADVRTMVCGAAALDVATQQRLSDLAGRPVFEGYGLTETAPALTSTLCSSTVKPGSIGQPLPGVELQLRDGDGNVLWPGGEDDSDDDGDPGEIWVRGANLFGGYWPDGRGGADPSGWWPTGDVAYADADGDLFLVDRLGELIIVSGFNVYPREIEDVLRAHPSVVDAAAIGLAHPYTGQTVKVYVVTRGQLTTDEVIAHCERSLARFKCPTVVEFVDELPRSVIGKVRKRELA